MRRSFALLVVVGIHAVAGCHATKPSTPPTPTSTGGSRAPSTFTTGADVVRAMHDRYADAWYRTLRFRQTVVRTAADGSHPPDEIWLEYADIPGKLRIDQAHDYNGNGVIYAGDSLFAFRDGQLTRRAAQRNMLLVLGFDVYRQPVDRTLQILTAEGFDVSRLRRARWEGRSVYVVGADEGDERSAQFWWTRSGSSSCAWCAPPRAPAPASRTSVSRRTGPWVAAGSPPWCASWWTAGK